MKTKKKDEPELDGICQAAFGYNESAMDGLCQAAFGYKHQHYKSGQSP